MSALTDALKAEITRLARKEIKTETESMRNAVNQYRHDIAALKKTIAKQQKQIDVLKRQEGKRIEEASEKLDAAMNGNVRWSSRSVRSQRKRLGLSAEDFGLLIGVSPQTIYNWEQGVSRAREEQFAKFREVREIGKREAMRRLELLEE